MYFFTLESYLINISRLVLLHDKRLDFRFNILIPMSISRDFCHQYAMSTSSPILNRRLLIKHFVYVFDLYKAQGMIYSIQLFTKIVQNLKVWKLIFESALKENPFGIFYHLQTHFLHLQDFIYLRHLRLKKFSHILIRSWFQPISLHLTSGQVVVLENCQWQLFYLFYPKVKFN